MSEASASVTIAATAITSVFGLLGSIVVAFKDEIKARFTPGKPTPEEIIHRHDLVPTTPSDAFALPPSQVRRRPFDSKIEMLQSANGAAHVFIVPLKREWSVPMAGWLLAWTVGLIAVIAIFFGLLFGTLLQVAA